MYKDSELNFIGNLLAEYINNHYSTKTSFTKIDPNYDSISYKTYSYWSGIIFNYSIQKSKGNYEKPNPRYGQSRRVIQKITNDKQFMEKWSNENMGGGWPLLIEKHNLPIIFGKQHAIEMYVKVHHKFFNYLKNKYITKKKFDILVN